MTSPGQSDRMYRLIEKYRDAGMSMYDAMQAAVQDLDQEDRLAQEYASHARRVSKSARTLNDTQVDLLCKHDFAGLAKDVRVREIERQHRGRK